jgi:hypothetical protein
VKNRVSQLAFALLAGALLLLAGNALAQQQEDAAERDPIASLREDVRALSDERMGGRGPDSDGLIRARDYITRRLQDIGVDPAGAVGYHSPFEVVVHARRDRSNALKIGERVLAPGAEFTPHAISDEVELSGKPVFVGYGLSLPQHGWDDYAEVDVRDRVVLALTGAPSAPPFTLAPEARYLLDPTSRAAVALSRGARAILFINDPRSHGDRSDQRPDQLPTLGIDAPLQGIAVGVVTFKAAQRALEKSGVDLEALQDRIDADGRPHSKALDVELSGKLAVDRERAEVHNIIARIEGKDASLGPVILGAHYDGLGFGFAGSLGDGERALHPGADDNASGVALLLEVARLLKGQSPERDIYLVAFSAEELGMLGSHYFARILGERAADAQAVTVDMVGRLGGELSLLGAERWRGPELALEQLATQQNLALAHLPADSSNSDHIAFMHAGIQTLHLTTGRHADYHTPRDTEDRISYEGLLSISRFTAALLLEMGNAK